MDNYGEILIYQSDDGLTNIEVKVQDETVWLTQQQMADLFRTSRTNVCLLYTSSFPRTVSRMSAQNRGIHFPAMSIPSAAVTLCPCTAVTWYSIVPRIVTALQDRQNEN